MGLGPKLHAALRRPKPTSLSRATGFNKIQVTRFFELLKQEHTTRKYTASQIDNVDESGITTVQTPGKIIAQKRRKQVGRIVSAERGSTTTEVCAMSPCGNYVPPVFIFKRKIMNDRFGSPPGSKGFPSPSGWMDSNVFIQYMQHFIDAVQPSEQKPVLLICDGHNSYKSLALIELARAHHVTILTIPPHTSHKLQPLDVTFFGPLKTAINRQMDSWMVGTEPRQTNNRL